MNEKMRTVLCPNCGKSIVWSTANTYRPFCSQRCKMIDLGAWASEDYNLPAEEDQPLSVEMNSIQH
jgi:uncharacterized protein